ncbi:MAG TPA: Hsp20/alpha crystallin family protein [Alphaproteobacteria bacterium]|nr:Hsp20/alpha crystallin family protein [Alphaproteobacteria bacterium]
MAIPTMFGRRGLPSFGNDPFSTMRREMDRLFDEFRGVGGGPYAAEVGFAPAVNVKQTDKGVEVTAELPGIDEKNVEVSLAENALTIRGEKKQEKEEKGEGWFMSERSFGSFMRTIPLPIEVDEAKVSAQFRNGVLTVTLPAAADTERKTKKIEVKPG